MGTAEFAQVEWDEQTIDDCRHLIRLAVREDLDRGMDLTTMGLVSESARGSAQIVARQPGVIAGLEAAKLALLEMQVDVAWHPDAVEGDPVEANQPVCQLEGSTRDLLTSERIVLNLIGRLSGIATLTRRYVRAVDGTSARIYDTRKTTPGWRRLEKFAVRSGGGHNHRTGLFDAVLIKDNHLAHADLDPAAAIVQARSFVSGYLGEEPAQHVPIEIEVDTLDQFRTALAAAPDIVLLDNMNNQMLATAVRERDAAQLPVVLEASGGVRLETVRGIAETGIDRISVGALTHAAACQDVGLDWETLQR